MDMKGLLLGRNYSDYPDDYTEEDKKFMDEFDSKVKTAGKKMRRDDILNGAVGGAGLGLIGGVIHGKGAVGKSAAIGTALGGALGGALGDIVSDSKRDRLNRRAEDYKYKYSRSDRKTRDKVMDYTRNHPAYKRI